jgi:hypothetical protein
MNAGEGDRQGGVMLFKSVPGHHINLPIFNTYGLPFVAVPNVCRGFSELGRPAASGTPASTSRSNGGLLLGCHQECRRPSRSTRPWEEARSPACGENGGGAPQRRRNASLGDLRVLIGEGGEQVYRPHGESMEVGVGVLDTFTEVELLNIGGIDEETACVGWVLHHGYTGALPSACNVRGLRVRCGNIQFGDDRMFEELFPEARFNAWSVGELHIIDPRIVPNGRRDHFEQSVHFHNLLTHLTPVAREITRRCRTSSVQRKWARDFELRETAIREKAAIIKQGALNRGDRYGMTEEIKAGVAFLNAIISKGILPAPVVVDLKKRKDKVERDVTKILNAPVKVSALADVPSSKRRAYEELIGLIYKCSASRRMQNCLSIRSWLESSRLSCHAKSACSLQGPPGLLGCAGQSHTRRISCQVK